MAFKCPSNWMNWELRLEPTPGLCLSRWWETVWSHRPLVAALGKCLARPGFTLPSHRSFLQEQVQRLLWTLLGTASNRVYIPFSPWPTGRGPAFWKLPWVSSMLASFWHVSNGLGIIKPGTKFPDWSLRVEMSGCRRKLQSCSMLRWTGIIPVTL